MLRISFAVLSLVLLLVGDESNTAPRSDAPGSKGTGEVAWTDTFLPKDLTRYKSQGQFVWPKRGGITLTPVSMLFRDTASGFDLDVRAEVSLPPAVGKSEPRIHITIRGGYDMVNTTVYLGFHNDRFVLCAMDSTGPEYLVPVEGDNPGEGPWHVRVRLRYGVVQGKVWPAGKPEPPEWHVTGYTGDSTWEPRRVGVYAGTGPAHVARLEVRGTAPVTNLLLKPDEPENDEALEVFRALWDVRLNRVTGQFEKGLEAARTTLARAQKTFGREHFLTALAHQSCGALLHDTGDYTEALKHFEETRAIARKVLPPDHPLIAQATDGIAVSLSSMGRANEGEQFAREALALRRRVLGDHHPETAYSWNHIGQALSLQQKHDEALECFERSLEIRQAMYGENHPDVAKAHNNVGYELLMLRKPLAARKHLDTALATYRKLLPKAPDHPDILLVRNNLGGVCYALGDHDGAATHLRAALDGFVEVYGRSHPNTAHARCLLSSTLAASGERDEALDHAAEGVAIYGATARRLLAGTPEVRHADITERWRPGVRMFLSLAAADPGRVWPYGPAVFNAAMDWKVTSGRALLDRLEALAVGQVPGAAETYETLRAERSELIRLIMRGPGPEGRTKYEARLKEGRELVDKLELELAERVKGYSAIIGARRAGPAEVARHLPKGSVLIEFVYLDEIHATIGALPKGVTEEAAYLAVVVIPRARGEDPLIKLVPLGSAKKVDEAVAAWLKLVNDMERAEGPEEDLRKAVWDPIAKVLPKGTDRLFIAPTGQLALVPFEAIWAENEFLVERFLISYCSTGRDLIPRPAAPGEPGPAVVVADPTFDRAGFDAGAPEPKGAAPAPVSALAFSGSLKKQRSLPGFAAEANTVEKLLKEKFPGNVKALRGGGATEDAVRGIARPRVLYFVTHGDFLPDQRHLLALEGKPVPVRAALDLGAGVLDPGRFGEDPRLRSYLCLTGFNHWRDRAKRGLSDGVLTAREAEELDLWGTELVVLAACNTGRGEVQVGEGVLGLRRAFLQAGARTVIASLWYVDDGKTAAFLPRFLTFWLAGTPKAEALRKAQIDAIMELRKASAGVPKQSQAPPFFWAAFVCHGLPN